MNTTRPAPVSKFRSRLRLFFIFLVMLIMVVGVGAAGGYLWYQDAINNAPTASAEPSQAITVAEGQSLLDIADELQAAGVLKSPAALRIYLRLSNDSLNLKKGKYVVGRNLNVPQLLELLEKGPIASLVTVTLTEGRRYDEMADRLSAAFSTISDRQFKKDEYNQIAATPDSYEFSDAVQAFLDKYKPKGKSLEGFLFADTYNFGSDARAIDVINLQITTLIRRLDDNKLPYSSPSRLKNFYEVLTLASIVEREANNLPDKKIVGDLFLRRLERKEVLGADAPLLYYFKDWQHVLRQSELDDKTNPYNMRALPGLPPTPITNPSINALKGVFEPTPNQYNYFISANGVNYYARTYAEHLRNINQYL